MRGDLNAKVGGADDFRLRIREALRNRLFPNTSLIVKQLAGGIGHAENSVSRWRNGESRLFADDLYRIARFFARRGDTKFLSEIFGDLLPGATASSQLEDMVLSLVRTAFTGLTQSGAPNRDACYWCTADGMLAVAPVGHGEFIRRALRLPADQAEDQIAYATSNLGWIALTISTHNNVSVEYDRWKLAPLAAERACEWLAERSNRIAGATCRLHIEGKWIETQHDSPNSLIAAISQAGVIRHNFARPWVVTRLSLDKVSHPRLKELLRIHDGASDKLVHAAAAIGALTTSNIFSVDGDDVFSQHAATEYAFNKQAVAGQNIMSRTDTNYASMVKSRVLQTQNDGPLYCAISGPLLGGYVRYFNLALPAGDNTVLTSTVPVGMTEE
jgi:transcriptional regulator with XRE-family HTH domain